MEILRNWWVRLGAVLTTAALTVFVPAAAWASTGPGEMVVEAARRRGRSSFGAWGLICCLVVVGLIVLALVVIMRNRRSGKRD
ncbi:hypothetical protein I0C86_13535 [Plantactinospora sp. S1510]|uniref:Uncharacterized protein n=1 Tax=Plantactinospora alkalitolerans TaxID=2789879 RepID=A0ABS0GUV5_9ACTN|nr:hypothetical protein [Plantactinospora alkalitolerans]MBF9129975.1 hypothetical protein [Plantactinospora alkalitolerans]